MVAQQGQACDARPEWPCEGNQHGRSARSFVTSNGGCQASDVHVHLSCVIRFRVLHASAADSLLQSLVHILNSRALRRQSACRRCQVARCRLFHQPLTVNFGHAVAQAQAVAVRGILQQHEPGALHQQQRQTGEFICEASVPAWAGSLCTGCELRTAAACAALTCTTTLRCPCLRCYQQRIVDIEQGFRSSAGA